MWNSRCPAGETLAGHFLRPDFFILEQGVTRLRIFPLAKLSKLVAEWCTEFSKLINKMVALMTARKTADGKVLSSKRGGARPNSGGARPNSGPKKGFGRYGEETKPMRVPVSLQPEVLRYIENKGFSLPVFASKVPLGSAIPASDDIDRMFNLNELIRHPASTFFHPMDGDSMEPTLFGGDLAMIDSAIEPKNKSVVLAAVDGGLTVKRFIKVGRRIILRPDNPKHNEIEFRSDQDRICGVMLISIRPIGIKEF